MSSSGRARRSQEGKAVDGEVYPHGYRERPWLRADKMKFAQRHDFMSPAAASLLTGGAPWNPSYPYVVRLPNGDFYQGGWDDDQMHGDGMFFNAVGSLAGAYHVGSYEHNQVRAAFPRLPAVQLLTPCLPVCSIAGTNHQDARSRQASVERRLHHLAEQRAPHLRKDNRRQGPWQTPVRFRGHVRE